MQFTLLNTVTRNIRLEANEDGTITVKNLIVRVGIVGAPEDKFIQVDVVSPNPILPAGITTSQQDAYLDTKAQEYVTATYPNS